MVNIDWDPYFEKAFKKIKDKKSKEILDKNITKIIINPEIGKPMRFARKGTREVYVGSFRLSYAYFKNEGKLIFLDLYHKDEQ